MLVTAALGCSSIDGYTTAPGESLCGSVTQSATFRAGIAPGAQMRLVLDASQLDGPGSPGTVWTYEPASGSSPDRRLLDGAPLRRLPAIENDPLGAPELGGGLDPTRIFALTASAPGEDSLLGVLSLRSDGGVEVRLLRPGTATSAPPGQGPIFALFSLGKQAGACGF